MRLPPWRKLFVQSRHLRLQGWVLLAIIVALGGAMRLYGISTMPAGLFGDEAAEGRDALRIIAGERPMYLEANFGREPLHAYLVALSVSAFGRTPAAVRLPSALAGCATIVGLFGLTRRLFGTRAGLIAAFLCAFSVWAVMLGRLATRPALLPCVLAFALWAGISGWQRRDAMRWVAAGLLFGLALYTYTPIRVIIFIVPVWLLVVGIHGSMRRMWPGVIYGAIGFVVCALPLIVYGASHPEVLFGRAGGLLVLNMDGGLWSAARVLALQTWKVAAMFGVPGFGDTNLRHNLPGRPALDWWIAVAAIWSFIGLASRRRHFAVIGLCLLGLSVLPTILSEEAPHFARGSGAMLVVLPLAALGIEQLQHWRIKSWVALKITAAAGALGFAAASAFSALWLPAYLLQSQTGFAFDEQCTRAAIDANNFLATGWRGAGWFADRRQPLAGRTVILARDVCPEYSSSGSDTVRFLVPVEFAQGGALRRYELEKLPPLATLPEQILFLAIPGDETRLAPWLGARYALQVEDGPWTPPDLLGNSWLVYRRVLATANAGS